MIMPSSSSSSSAEATATAINNNNKSDDKKLSSSSLLVNRLENNVLEPPTYGMEGTDIFYPKWFSGNWKTVSTTQSVEAPCGIALFGGNATYINAQKDIGNVLKYDSRFLMTPNTSTNTNTVVDNDTVIADREFNVKSIVKVTMGENSIVDVSTATPNKFCCLLALKNSSSLLQVDLIALNRRSEPQLDGDPNKFACAEVVREIAKTVNNNNNNDDKSQSQQQKQKRKPTMPSVLKEIETTSIYTYIPESDEVHCIQRSAAFLLPSDQNEMAMRMWQLSRGRAIDVRYYNVIYTRATSASASASATSSTSASAVS